MSQQINLLNPDLRPRVDLLNLGNVVLVGSLILVAVLLMAAWGRQREGVELTRLRAQEQQMRVAQEQLEQLAAMQANRHTNPQLEQQLVARQELLDSKQQVADMLESGSLGKQEGFSGFMEALARQVPDGLWLTGLDFQAGGRAILLQGGLISEPLLPLLVRQLDSEAVFKGRHFSTLQIHQQAPKDVPAGTKDERTPLERAGYLVFSLEGGPAVAAGGRP